MKKSAALLITLFIVSTLGALALVTAKSSIMALIASTRSTHAVIAEEASKSGIEESLLRCVAATQSNTDPIEINRSLSGGASFAALLYVSILSDVKNCAIVSTGKMGSTYKKREFTYGKTLQPSPPPPTDGYAYLFNGDTKLGYFFLISGETEGGKGEGMVTNYLYINSSDDYAMHPIAPWGSWHDLTQWGFVELNRVRQGNSDWDGSVRVLGNAGNLLGYLHVLREDPSGTFIYNGLKLKDEGRFVDSSVAADISDIHSGEKWFALSGAIRKDYGGADSVKVEELSGGNLEITFRRAIENYLTIVNKLHFLVIDETKSEIIGKLVGVDTGTSPVHEEFRGSAYSWEDEGGPNHNNLYVSATGTSEVGNGTTVFANFKAAHPNFRYKLAP